MTRFVVLLPVVIAFLVGAVPALAWTWPVDGPVLQQFSIGEDPYEGGQHRGIDIGGPVSSPVRAPAGGSVSFAGRVPGGGRTLTIRTPDGYAVTLQQLGTVSVSRGTIVAEGDPIGTVGASSEADVPDPHVHLGVRIASDPNGYVDPLGLLPGASSGMEAETEASGSIVDTDAAVTTAESSPQAPDTATGASVVEPVAQEAGAASQAVESTIGDTESEYTLGGLSPEPEDHGSVVPAPATEAAGHDPAALTESRRSTASTGTRTHLAGEGARSRPRPRFRTRKGAQDDAGFAIAGASGRQDQSSPARDDRTATRTVFLEASAEAGAGLRVDTEGTPGALIPVGMALISALLAVRIFWRRRHRLEPITEEPPVEGHRPRPGERWRTH